MQQYLKNYLYRKDFYFVDQFHESALHGNRCTMAVRHI
jgi:hypothetical protein